MVSAANMMLEIVSLCQAFVCLGEPTSVQGRCGLFVGVAIVQVGMSGWVCVVEAAGGCGACQREMFGSVCGGLCQCLQ